MNFSIVQATNISLVYTIDAYRPVAGEITVSQFAFKCESQLSSPFSSCLTDSIAVQQPPSVSYSRFTPTPGLPRPDMSRLSARWRAFLEESSHSGLCFTSLATGSDVSAGDGALSGNLLIGMRIVRLASNSFMLYLQCWRRGALFRARGVGKGG